MSNDSTVGRRARRTAAAGLFAGALGLALAACTSGGGGRPVASLTGSQGASSSTAMPTESQWNQDAVHFVHCLRAHGVNEPDPFQRPGHSGLTIEVPSPTAANNAALSACNHFIAKEVAAKEAGASRQLAQWRPHLVQYAQCMRTHDIPMLDPGPQGELNLGNVPGITSDFGRYSPQFRSADAACRHLLPAGVHDDGTGP